MTEPEQAPEQVIEANLNFYFALESLDVELMEDVWLMDANACCIHPGGERLSGWEAIRETWERIFKSTTYMRVDITDVSVEVHGNAAWVTCLENIATSAGGQTHRARAYATNIFTYEEDSGWMLVVHHASLINE
ncbi:MAG TPA: nuclear transport factor 2 family protein [Terriglobia bacterium]|nr:nuclear transport factor 2 family protein [Terriglobia bacterium]